MPIRSHKIPGFSPDAGSARAARPNSSASRSTGDEFVRFLKLKCPPLKEPKGGQPQLLRVSLFRSETWAIPTKNERMGQPVHQGLTLNTVPLVVGGFPRVVP
jgi:hypothetical protein